MLNFFSRLFDSCKTFRQFFRFNIVLSSLLCLSQLMLYFDPSLVLLSWKGVGKLVCRLKNHAHILHCQRTARDLSLCSVVCGMCEAMVRKSEECMKSSSDSVREL